MSEARRQQLKEKIAAAEARNAEKAGTLMDRAGEKAIEAKDRFTAFAKNHPVAVIAGGIGAGIAISMVFKRSPSRRVAARASGKASALTALGMELASAYARHAMDAAGEARDSGSEKLHELGDRFGKKAQHLRRDAGDLVEDLGDEARIAGHDSKKAIRRALRSWLN